MSSPTAEPARRGYPRYVAPPARAGMDRLPRNLECLLRETRAIGPVPVLPPPHPHLHHNFGIARAWRWDDFLDLDAGRLVDAAGVEHPLPLAGHVPPGLPVARLHATAAASARGARSASCGAAGGSG